MISDRCSPGPCSRLRSRSGSPSTIRRAAKASGATVPSSPGRGSAPTTVAERMISSGESGPRSASRSWRAPTSSSACRPRSAGAASIRRSIPSPRALDSSRPAPSIAPTSSWRREFARRSPRCWRRRATRPRPILWRSSGPGSCCGSPSTPHEFAEAVRVGLARLADEHGVDLREIGTVVHGTTIAVNTLIQRTGARLGLLVTDGFRDVLELQRLRLTNPFDLHGSRPLPLIPRARVAEVRERLRADGRVDTPLDESSVREAVRQLTRAGQGVEGLVISLLHAYRSPAHERQARAVAEATNPGLPVTASSDVWPQAREYERTALAVVDAYVQSKVRRYLEGFEQALTSRGAPATPLVTKSNGGIMPVAAARSQTAATVLSGPASAVLGAAYVAGRAGLPNVITLDVGGTSADMAVVENRRPRVSTSEHIGGVPVMMPVVGVSAIGAGGGSVAWVDDVGLPKVGPQSTGAEPGPACYGRGGKNATLTDAFLVSGFLDPDRFLGGRMRLNRSLAEE